MKRNRKNRAVTADVRTFNLRGSTFVTPIPYDKKDRVIPSSVDCAYNLEYFQVHEAIDTLRTL